MTPFKSPANQILDRCDSTNNVAKNLGEQGCFHGTWVSARIQENGRGRLGRQWESRDGNLFLSVVARIDDKALWSWVPLTTAVAVTRCLRSLLPKLKIKIKWPNDLCLEGAKVGGILCESSGSFIVIGLGLNCTEAPQRVEQPALSLTQACDGRTVHADFVRFPILDFLGKELDELVAHGPHEVRSFYEGCAFLPHKTEVEWESGLVPVTQVGTVHGLGPVGDLQVIRQNGVKVSLFAEDVRLRRYSESIR